MPKFRKKPVEVKAEQVSALLEKAKNNWKDLPEWFKEQYEAGNALLLPNRINIVTLEGTMTADIGDYVICGVIGEIYPCKPDIFHKTYEPVREKELIGDFSQEELTGIKNRATDMARTPGRSPKKIDAYSSVVLAVDNLERVLRRV